MHAQVISTVSDRLHLLGTTVDISEQVGQKQEQCKPDSDKARCLIRVSYQSSSLQAQTHWWLFVPKHSITTLEHTRLPAVFYILW